MENARQPIAVTFHGVAAVLGENKVLDGIDCVAPGGGSTAVVGPNGAGKTTLLKALLGLLPYKGRIDFTGTTSPRFGYVPQKLDFDAGMPLTVLEFICLNWRRLPLWFGVGRKNRRRALDLLEQVGMCGLWSRRLGDLSGGELRRVLLAMALGRDPELLVLDEPTAGVDYKGEMAFYQLLDRLRHRNGFTQIMVCHNLEAVRRHASWVICLNRRVIAQGSPDATLTAPVLGQTFLGQDSGFQPECAPPHLENAALEKRHA